MKKALILILPLLFSGCLYVNDRGIDTSYYNECTEYYDAMGVYHKKCDKNLIEFQEVEDGTKQIIEKTKNFVENSSEVN
jgi:hypothetical protein